ncbi:MAG: LysM peptidoglycan-binding domain-containing protein [Anaerolineae bacterium]
MRTKIPIIVVLVAMLLIAATPVAAAPTACCGQGWHCVQRGETLFSIGRLYNVSPWAIASANGLVNPNCIYAGQCLRIPAGPAYPGCPGCQPCPGCSQYYIVRCGDTLFSIGRRFGVNPWSIARANGLQNPNYIWKGQRLCIPCGYGCCP